LAAVVIEEGVTGEVRRIGISAVLEGRVHRPAEVVDRAQAHPAVADDVLVR